MNIVNMFQEMCKGLKIQGHNRASGNRQSIEVLRALLFKVQEYRIVILC